MKLPVITTDIRGCREEVLDGINIIYAPTYKNLHKSIFHRAIAFLSFAFSFPEIKGSTRILISPIVRPRQF